MDETYSRLFYHVTWETKHRAPLVTGAIEPMVRNCIFRKADHLGCTIHAFGATDDHVHIAIQIPPMESLSRVIGQIKGFTSHSINERELVKEGLYWQEGFGSFTVSEEILPKVVAYIVRQRENHARVS